MREVEHALPGTPHIIHWHATGLVTIEEGGVVLAILHIASDGTPKFEIRVEPPTAEARALLNRSLVRAMEEHERRSTVPQANEEAAMESEDEKRERFYDQVDALAATTKELASSESGFSETANATIVDNLNEIRYAARADEAAEPDAGDDHAGEIAALPEVKQG